MDLVKLMQQDRVGWQQHKVKDVQPLQTVFDKKRLSYCKNPEDS